MLGAVPVTYAGAQSSPVGVWRTNSDVAGTPPAIVEIRVDHDALVGVIRSVSGPDSAAKCEQCPGDRRGRPLIGLQIIRGMRLRGREWTGGEILDPDTGKVYRATMRLDAAGTRLIVRGYIGIQLLGRSQTWVRVG